MRKDSSYLPCSPYRNQLKVLTTPWIGFGKENIIIEGFNWFFQALREFRGITLPKDKMFL